MDIVVEAPGLYLVIESKVDAEEAGQCYYYSQHLSADALCVLLSPDGRLPAAPKSSTECDPETVNRFKPLRYSQVSD